MKCKNAIARMKWTKEVNVAVMECFYQSRPFTDEGKPILGYRQRMHRKWEEQLLFPVTEQRLCDQARMIRKNGWLTSVELEEIKRRVMEDEDGTQRNLEVNMNNEEIESNQNGDEMYTNNDDNIQRTREEHDEQSGGNTMPEITIMCDSEQATEEEKEMVISSHYYHQSAGNTSHSDDSNDLKKH
eukprot:Seg1199.3 transcript_id=Seg1199.3/GoldUCD/mRNA.D3Y31 product="hypothetical protein" protein_id=Seg1199.3/GoldUCD/D3Y31